MVPEAVEWHSRRYPTSQVRQQVEAGPQDVGENCKCLGKRPEAVSRLSQQFCQFGIVILLISAL